MIKYFDTSEDNMIFYAIIGFFISVGLILLLRNFYSWYLKIDEVLRGQQEIKDLLKKLDKSDQ